MTCGQGCNEPSEGAADSLIKFLALYENISMPECH